MLLSLQQSRTFYSNCLLMKAARDKKQLNGKEGMVMVKGAWTPLKSADAAKTPHQEAQVV